MAADDPSGNGYGRGHGDRHEADSLLIGLLADDTPTPDAANERRSPLRPWPAVSPIGLPGGVSFREKILDVAGGSPCRDRTRGRATLT